MLATLIYHQIRFVIQVEVLMGILVAQIGQ
jgi:hypothetical protein